MFHELGFISCDFSTLQAYNLQLYVLPRVPARQIGERFKNDNNDDIAFFNFNMAKNGN